MQHIATSSSDNSAAGNEARQDSFFQKSWHDLQYFIVLVDDMPRGYVCLEHLDDHIKLHELVIGPEFQGRGVGTRILRNILRDATARCVPVRLQVLKENRARELYVRLGFVEVGKTETHFQMQWRDGQTV